MLRTALGIELCAGARCARDHEQQGKSTQSTSANRTNVSTSSATLRFEMSLLLCLAKSTTTAIPPMRAIDAARLATPPNKETTSWRRCNLREFKLTVWKASMLLSSMGQRGLSPAAQKTEGLHRRRTIASPRRTSSPSPGPLPQSCGGARPSRSCATRPAPASGPSAAPRANREA